MSLVLDTSATLAWVYLDETSLPIREVFDWVNESGAWVPSLWRLEIANVLEMGFGAVGMMPDFETPPYQILRSCRSTLIQTQMANGRFLNVPPELQSKLLKLQRRVSLLLQHTLP